MGPCDPLPCRRGHFWPLVLEDMFCPWGRGGAPRVLGPILALHKRTDREFHSAREFNRGFRRKWRSGFGRWSWMRSLRVWPSNLRISQGRKRQRCRERHRQRDERQRQRARENWEETEMRVLKLQGKTKMGMRVLKRNRRKWGRVLNRGDGRKNRRVWGNETKSWTEGFGATLGERERVCVGK